MTRVLTAFTSAAMVFATACATAPAPPADTAADVAAINALADREIAAFAAAETGSFASLFAPDAIVMPPNEPSIQGLDALVTWTSDLASHYTLAGAYTSSDVVVDGDLAVHRFTATLSMTPQAGGEAMAEDVKGVHVLRRQADGSWRIVHDVWNANRPAPAGGN